jgi:ketosteroid isomerase-like protein
MARNPADVYRALTKAFSEGDRATVDEMIADDVVWHTDDNQVAVPSEFHGKAEFFAAAGSPRELVSSWEVIPHLVLGNENTLFCHQIDRFFLKDGSEQVIHFLLHIEFNDRGQISEVWEFGQSAIPH